MFLEREVQGEEAGEVIGVGDEGCPDCEMLAFPTSSFAQGVNTLFGLCHSFSCRHLCDCSMRVTCIESSVTGIA